MSETKFPFEPNEKVKAAFRNETARKQALDVMVKALYDAAAEVANPWDILRLEYPELSKEIGSCAISYNYFTEMISLRPKL